jgi:hypothetical protein
MTFLGGFPSVQVASQKNRRKRSLLILLNTRTSDGRTQLHVPTQRSQLRPVRLSGLQTEYAALHRTQYECRLQCS